MKYDIIAILKCSWWQIVLQDTYKITFFYEMGLFTMHNCGFSSLLNFSKLKFDSQSRLIIPEFSGYHCTFYYLRCCKELGLTVTCWKYFSNFSLEDSSLVRSFETIAENKNVNLLAEFIQTDAVSRYSTFT